MTDARMDRAGQLVKALEEWNGFKAAATEQRLAVVVIGRKAEAVVWLPDDLVDGYVWGRDFEHKAPGAWGADDVARAVAVTLV